MFHECGLCSGAMVVRTNSFNGEKFWGCSRYPRCKHTVDDVKLNDTIQHTTVEVGAVVEVNTRTSCVRSHHADHKPECEDWELATVLGREGTYFVVTLLRNDWRGVSSASWRGRTTNTWFVCLDEIRRLKEGTMGKYKTGDEVLVDTHASSIRTEYIRESCKRGDVFVEMQTWEPVRIEIGEPVRIEIASNRTYSIKLTRAEVARDELWFAKEEWLKPLGEKKEVEKKEESPRASKTKTAVAPKEQLKSLGAVVGAGVAMGATDKVGDVFIRIARKLSKNSPLIEALLDDYLGREIVKLLIASSLRTTALSAPQLVPGSEHIASASDLQITFSVAKLSSAGLDLLGEELKLLSQLGQSLALPSETEAQVVGLEELREERTASRRAR